MRNTPSIYGLRLLMVLGALVHAGYGLAQDPGNAGTGLMESPGGQADPARLVDHYIRTVPNDRTYVQTDRDTYFTGETVWFTAWYTDDVTGIPVRRNRVSYVELVDETGVPLEQLTFAHLNSHVEGSVELPLDIPSGTYYLRVYHNWQKQFGADLTGLRLIQVINPYLPPKHLKPEKPGLRCRVFPEGGSFVAGEVHQVVAEVRTDNGNYAEISGGCVISDLGDTITSLVAEAKGLGSFSLIPETGRSYTLLVEGCDPVPLKVLEHGSRITIEKTPGGFRALWRMEIPSQDQPGFLVAMHEGNLLVAHPAGTDETLSGSSADPTRVLRGDLGIPDDDLPHGVISFYLLDHHLNPLSTRLLLHMPAEPGPPLTITSLDEVYGSRDTVDLQISVSVPDGISHLTVSVFSDLFGLPAPVPESWLAMHLHSQLNDWDDFRQLSLFQGDTLNREILDRYMQTRELKRHRWNRIRDHERFLWSDPMEGEKRYYDGQASVVTDGSPYGNREILVFFMDKNPYMLKTTTDRVGHFRFAQPMTGMPKQMVQFQPAMQDTAIKVSLDLPYLGSYHPYNLHFFRFDSTRQEDFDRAFINWQINMLHKEQIRKGIRTVEPDQPPSFFQGAKKRFYMDDYITFLNMEEVFKEIVNHVKIRGREGNRKFVIFDDVANMVIGEHPLVLFNGQPVEGVEAILRIQEKEVEFVDVVPRAFFIGHRRYDGLLNVVTWHKTMQMEVPGTNYRTLLDGSIPVRRFSPETGPDPASERLPDLRNTLFWEPDLPVEGNQAQVRFTTGDDRGNYTLILRGMDRLGRVFELRKRFRVD